ncbi:MAG: hypothetical protein JNL79_39290 [Myxococcales bacterium]|nr:hypothetical protein [Myxococcales bacterium]
MTARKLLTLAGSVGLTLAARGALSPVAACTPPTIGNDPATVVSPSSPSVASVPTYEPLLDSAGRPAPGNVVGKGGPSPQPQPSDAGADAK